MAGSHSKTTSQRIRVLLPAALACLMAGCSTAPQWKSDLGMPELLTAPASDAQGLGDTAGLPRIAADAPRTSYRIGAQDELAITVWGPREIWAEITPQAGQSTQTVIVQDDGTIALPMLRRLPVEGLTMSEALAKITEGYRAVVGSKFQVDGKIARTHSKAVLIEGALVRPGVAYLGPELETLGDAIGGVAGGLLDTADLSHGTLVRDRKSYRLDYQPARLGESDLHRIALKAGDRIFFPSRAAGVLYVFGEVGTQGAIPIPPEGITLLQALAIAKGPQMPTADMETIYLVRPGREAPLVYRLSLQQIMSTRDVAMAVGDRVFVPPTKLTDWDRTMRQLLPILSSSAVVYTGIGN